MTRFLAHLLAPMFLLLGLLHGLLALRVQPAVNGLAALAFAVAAGVTAIPYLRPVRAAQLRADAKARSRLLWRTFVWAGAGLLLSFLAAAAQ